MVAHDTISDEHYVLCDAAVMAVDLSKFSIIDGSKYGEPLYDPVCACGFEKALLARKLIYFGDQARQLTDLFELLFTR